MVSIFTGRSGFKRRLREFNPCHDPKTGMFAPKGAGDCGPGDWDDPGRQRSVYGNFIDDPDLNALDPEEANALQRAVNDAVAATAGEQKDVIATQLAEHLERTLSDEQMDALYVGLEDYGLRSHLQSIDSDNDSDDNGGSEEPDPADESIKEKYAEYEEEAQQAAQEAFYEHESNEYGSYVEKMIDKIGDVLDEMLPEIEAIQQERRDNGETDPSIQTPLPGFDQRVNTPISLRDALAAALEPSGGLDVVKGLEEDESIELDEDELGALRDFLLTQSPYAPIRNDLATTEDRKALYEEAGHEYFDGNKYKDGFEKYREDQMAGEPDYDDVKSFDHWYKSEYGIWPDDWEAGDGGGDDSDGDVASRGKAYGAASFLLHTWAETSGDSNVVSVALQQAAEQAFNLGPTYAGLFVKDKHGAFGGGDRFIGQTKGFYSQHKAALDAFVKGMYDNTQNFLKRIPGDHITLYRGMKFGGTDDPGWESLSAHLYGHGSARGAMVDVLLQPVSSFSTNYSTADGFTGSGGPVFAIRVPKSRILSTTASGFGALSEFEVTVLGGRYPAFASPAGSISNFWKIYQSYKRRGPVATDPFPGEAW